MPRFIQRLYPELVWAFFNKKNSVYLTFDDGPIPEVTPWVLDELKKFNAKATFFCIGENVRKHPEIFERIIAEGHAVGNHTFNHLNGWKTSTSEYIGNVVKAERQMQDSGFNSHNFRNQNSGLLFRPPYGKITGKQSKSLRKKGYKIVMWDIISYDYDSNVSKEKCLQNVLKNLKGGSIIVFHDSLKAEKNLRFVLPKVLNVISNKKFSIKKIPTF
ncbi:polysaccharide deacetylase family protein [Aequorivita echinoideorum]|uniref:Polysaccharide deacetylase family protein n=1 Tax=Aequorivita echinoideorum TaxID=1549647 RepID=A0ABS5S3H4_9FLAO|nr:polysaccharide deacetylase family protein [Aequorivita echinoideorum]MBT0607759.1 polysaccharide deacetylase family protein [Aequorivita echinoideorum]